MALAGTGTVECESLGSVIVPIEIAATGTVECTSLGSMGVYVLVFETSGIVVTTMNNAGTAVINRTMDIYANVITTVSVSGEVP
jgi:hypothetical protein